MKNCSGAYRPALWLHYREFSVCSIIASNRRSPNARFSAGRKRGQIRYAKMATHRCAVLAVGAAPTGLQHRGPGADPARNHTQKNEPDPFPNRLLESFDEDRVASAFRESARVQSDGALRQC